MLRTLRRLPPIPTPKRSYATKPPPPAGPYKPANQSTPPPGVHQSKPTSTSTSTSTTPPSQAPSPTPPKPFEKPALDPARGAAASLKAAREGVLDPRYKPASRRVVAIICAVPIFLVTSWVLFQRRFLGVEQKVHKARKVPEEGEGNIGEGVIGDVVGEGK